MKTKEEILESAGRLWFQEGYEQAEKELTKKLIKSVDEVRKDIIKEIKKLTKVKFNHYKEIGSKCKKSSYRLGEYYKGILIEDIEELIKSITGRKTNA